MVKLTDLMQMIVLPCERSASTKHPAKWGEMKNHKTIHAHTHFSTVGFRRNEFAKPMKMKWTKYRQIVGLSIESIHTQSRLLRFLLKVTEHKAGAATKMVPQFNCLAYLHTNGMVRKVRHKEEIPNCLGNRGSSRRKWMPLSSSFVSRTQNTVYSGFVPLWMQFSQFDSIRPASGRWKAMRNSLTTSHGDFSENSLLR